ncbi:hypothetical protein LPJ56_004166 [Coemansia sp. RSA 2599]|nr:hypothetical protein LPJ75_003998 [Coemansia sp. RSA 2598]KAJ1816987.1 hypothetical protein LPJ56_004166 [Coemansia sp. RSA 2599]
MPPTLQTLPKQILNKILNKYYDRQLPSFHPKFFRVYKHAYELSQLCRALREALKPYIYGRLIFERYNLAVEGVEARRSTTMEETKAMKKLPPITVWKSNIRLIENCDMWDIVTHVIISTYDRYPDPEDVLAMLKEKGFDRHQYPNTHILVTNFKSDFDIDDKVNDDVNDWIPDESFNALGQYLSQHLTHIDTMWMEESRCRRVGLRNAMSPFVSANLDKFRKLHFRFSYMPSFGVKVLPQHITHLTLSVHSAYDYIDIPKISTPVLQSLTLSAIPISYLWDRFVNYPQQPGVIEFPELFRLDLSFHQPYRRIPAAKTEDDYMWERYSKENTGADDPDGAYQTESYKGNTKLKTISVKDQSAKYTVLRTDTRRPRFPKLRRLRLNHYPSRVSEFLKCVPAEQIEYLCISGDLITFKGFRLAQFTNLRNSTIMQFSDTTYRQSPHVTRFMTRVLSQPSKNLLTLDITSSSKSRVYLPPAEKITCSSIRKLYIMAYVSYEDIPVLLENLPRLEQFDLQRAMFIKPPMEAETPEGLADMLLATGMQPISTSLIRFIPDVMCRSVTDAIIFYNLFVLIARIPSLRELKMFGFYSAQFSNELSRMLAIPRLRDHIRHLSALEYDDP